MLLHQLEIFIQVAEEKSFSKAAENIYLSQSTISTHIGSLEKYYGQKLFDRMGREIRLTYAGEKLYPIAKEMIRLEKEALGIVSDQVRRIEGNIRIAASSVPAQYMVPKLIAEFHSRYPDTKISLNLMDSIQVAENLIKGEADIGILSHRYFPERLQFQHYQEEKLVLITPTNVSLKKNVALDELLKHPVLFRKQGSGTQVVVEELLEKAKVDIKELNVVGYFDSVQVVKQCVKEGMGISIISEIAARDYVEYGLINAYPLKEQKENRVFYVAHNLQRTKTPAVSEFIDWAMESEMK